MAFPFVLKFYVHVLFKIIEFFHQNLVLIEQIYINAIRTEVNCLSFMLTLRLSVGNGKAKMQSVWFRVTN